MHKRKQSSQKNSSSKLKIILDTNLFSDLTDQHLASPITAYLFDLDKRGFEFAISDITLYELMRGQTTVNEKKRLDLLSSVFRYNLSSDIMITSAQLDNLMKMENIQVNGIDHGDKFIAATAILSGSLILTADVRGFPWPFFHELEYNPLIHKIGNKTKSHMIGLLQPDFDLTKRRFGERP
jgi:predicted nucleic acid-binding protein